MRSPSFRILLPLGLVLALGLAVYSQLALQVGYGVLSVSGGNTTPVSSALFRSLALDGTLVWEAGVAAVQTRSSGRVFVDQRAGTRTAVALVNPSSESATVSMTLRNSLGGVVAQQDEPFGPGQHKALFVDELFLVEPGFNGSLTFDAGGRTLGAITLRENHNLQGESIFATLPVVDLSVPASSDAVVFPQVGAGSGLSTQIVLINPTSSPIGGRLEVFGTDGQPLVLALDQEVGSSFDYQIQADGTFRGELTLSSGLESGFALIRPNEGDAAPAGSAIFQFTSGTAVISEAGVGSAPLTTRTRVFVDQDGTRSGVALANPEAEEASVTFELLDLDGSSRLLEENWTIAAQGHLARFADELFADLPIDFVGLMEIRSDVPLAPITLKLTINSRNQPIITTLPVADLTRPLSANPLVFAQIGFGDFGAGSFATRLILIDDRLSSSSGNLDFFQSSGSPMNVPLGGQNGNSFSWDLSGGGGLELRPGQEVAVQIIIDPNQPTSSEVVVNRGRTLQLNPVAVDSGGSPVSGSSFSYVSLDTEIATVDASGLISGLQAGFSTLTVSDGTLIATATITVTEVRSAPGAFGLAGVEQDLSQQIYLANSLEHTILLSRDLESLPDTYAGTRNVSGLADDERLKALFKRPSFLALDLDRNDLYVSDTENHAIRVVEPGLNGRVRSIAGDGTSGSSDGVVTTARFREPQGIAIDREGTLWVADSGNHTVRRVNLVSGTVETVAGVAGQPGFADGTGSSARFNRPVGLAVINETFAQETDREFRGEPPPPVTVVVSDSGNGFVRTVTSAGVVQTVGTGQGAAVRGAGKVQTQVPATFQTPAGIAVDPAGNILVTEPSTGRVRMILLSGEVVDAVQEGTFTAPRGIIALGEGQVLVADQETSASQVEYGAPEIDSISPSEVDSSGGDLVSILGRNFAPDTVLIVTGVVIEDLEIRDSQTLVFKAPHLPSGRGTVTVQNRGGLAQSSLLVRSVPLSSLPVGYITTVAGGSSFTGDGALAVTAALRWPHRTTIDSAGNLYIADTNSNRIRRVDRGTGVITTVAGTGTPGNLGDGGPATAARLSWPKASQLDQAGNLYILDYFGVRKVDAATGVISTVLDFFAESTSISEEDLAIDGSGNLYIADFNSRVLRLDSHDGSLSVVAGTGQFGFSGDGGPANEAQLSYVTAITLDGNGNLYIAEFEVGSFLTLARVRLVDATTGVITTLVDVGELDLSLSIPRGITVDRNGTLYIVDAVLSQVLIVDRQTGTLSALAGTAFESGYSGDGGPALMATLNFPEGVSVDGSGNLYIADTLNDRIRKVDALSGTISTMVGNEVEALSGDGGPATAALLDPFDLAFDAAGNLYISEIGEQRIRKVDPAGIITTFAGSGIKGFSGDGGPAADAMLNLPLGIAIDRADNLYIADWLNDRIRKVESATGNITTVAGGGFEPPPTAASQAALASPCDIAVDAHGNLYIADDEFHTVYRVDVATEILSTYAGTRGLHGFSGDGGPATAAHLSNPCYLALDSAGNLFVADIDNHRIRRIDALTEIITTVAGNGDSTSSGDGGPAILAALPWPGGIVFDSQDRLYIAEFSVRRVDLSTGIISAVGAGGFGSLGDGGPALDAAGFFSGLTIDAHGNLYIADHFYDRVRAIRGPLP